MNRFSSTLMLIILLSLTEMVFVSIPINLGLVQAALAVLFVLIAPGCALTMAIFRQHTIGIAERILFIIGLSLVLAVVGGLILNWTGWGLLTTSWTLLLGSISVTACIIAFLRQQTSTFESDIVQRMTPKINLREGLLFSGAILIAGLAMAVAQIGATQQVAGFTQLWIRPVQGGEENIIHLGLQNDELMEMRYRLQLEAGTSKQQWQLITLKPGENWEVEAKLPIAAINIERVDAKLYRLDAPSEVYRWVTLWPEEQRK